MRGAVLRHVTSQHYVFAIFSYKLNEGQCQRSRSVKIKIKTKIPYYRPLEERKKGQVTVERGGARKKGHFLSKNNLLNLRD